MGVPATGVAGHGLRVSLEGLDFDSHLYSVDTGPTQRRAGTSHPECPWTTARGSIVPYAVHPTHGGFAPPTVASSAAGLTSAIGGHCHSTPVLPLRGRCSPLHQAIVAGFGRNKGDLGFFGDCSVLHINVHKTLVEPIACSDEHIRLVREVFPAQISEFPITYLGCLSRSTA
jgi:hypothetical protein